MPILTAALLLVGALCALDLILTLGVIKRLREHTDLLANSGGMGAPALAAGEEVGAFTATTMDGEPLTGEQLAEDTLVAFFSPTCGPCKETMPKFVQYAPTVPGGRDRVLAVVVGEPDEAAGPVGALSPVARVVVENVDGALGEAFKVKAYPTVLKVGRGGDGRLVVRSNAVDLSRPDVAAV